MLEFVAGVPMIKGRNLKVRMIAQAYLHAGESIEAVIDQYGLSKAEIHAALAYYYDHLADFEREARDLAPLLQAAQTESEARLARMRANAQNT